MNSGHRRFSTIPVRKAHPAPAPPSSASSPSSPRPHDKGAHRLSTKSQLKEGLSRDRFTTLCASHSHSRSAAPLSARTGEARRTSPQCSAQVPHGYTDRRRVMNCVTSCRCRRVGRSGYWAARVWRRCHVARPTSARAASSVLREADVDVDANVDVDVGWARGRREGGDGGSCWAREGEAREPK